MLINSLATCFACLSKVNFITTQTNGYVHFYSNHHSSIKLSVFNSMFLRALKICDPEFLDQEIANIYEIGKKLCYPSCFLDTAFERASKSYHGLAQSRNFNYENILCLPFYREFSHLPRMMKQFNVNVIFKYENT